MNSQNTTYLVFTLHPFLLVYVCSLISLILEEAASRSSDGDKGGFLINYTIDFVKLGSEDRSTFIFLAENCRFLD